MASSIWPAQQAHADLVAMAHLGRIAVGLLTVQVQLARVDLLAQPGAEAAQLGIVRLGLVLLLRDGQVAAERLDVEVGQLQTQLEGIAGRSQAFLEDGAGFVQLVAATINGGQLQIQIGAGRILLETGAQRTGFAFETILQERSLVRVDRSALVGSVAARRRAPPDCAHQAAAMAGMSAVLSFVG